MEEEIEIWKDVPNYEGLYMVSNFGRIKSLPRTYTSGYGRITHNPEKLMALPKINSGYLCVGLSKYGVKKTFTVQDVVALAFIPNPDNLPEVNHKFGNKEDNRPSQLEWSTRSGNLKHAYDTGLKVVTHTKGEGNGRAILNEMQVRQIKRRMRDGERNNSIAKSFGVGKHVIAFIKANKTWAHVI
jgi:hypothetical protein